ncbi:glycosyltransferase family 4 protein [Brevundimonas sp. A19_0]|uniref:glycosyltransferase family 4 protein n=1 Tax=Brevundimonas sp. A19_0 TaxID=2821087 RepID=UPI0032AF41F5
MHVLVLASFAPSLTGFRGPLIAEMVRRGWRVTAAAPDFDAASRAAVTALGARPVEVPMARTGMNPLADLAYRRTLISLLRREQPDVLLAYTIKPVIWGLLAARAVGVPRSVALITGLGYAFTDGTGGGLKRTIAGVMASTLYRLALRHADRVLFQNPDDRDLFMTQGLLRDRGQIAVVDGSGVDLDHYSPAPLPEAPVFLMIGRLLGAKGVREYAAASMALKARHPGARFQLVGWRDPGPDTVTEAELQGWIDGGIEYLGRLEDVRPAIADARVYVLPSYREGTPRSVLEAMAMGRPIITTDAPGCRETVVSGENGLLVPPRDAAALEAAMEQLLTNPAQTAAMGRASLECVRARYDVHRVNDQILSAVPD